MSHVSPKLIIKIHIKYQLIPLIPQNPMINNILIFLYSRNVNNIPLIFLYSSDLSTDSSAGEAKGSQEDALQRLALAAPALVESRDRRGEALAAGPLVYIVYIL
jgi:hypothetical protein